MFKLLQKILALILALVVLTTTTGFRIYSHDCDCCGTEEISLVEIQECCGESGNATCDISHMKDADCCTGKEPIHHDCKKSQCCSVDSDFYKFYQLFEKSKVLTVHTPNFENFPIQIIDTEPLVTKAITGFLDTSEDSPPRIPVREFVIFSHSLKIDC